MFSASRRRRLILIVVWRIIVGISLVPAFATLYQRLTLPEARRFKASRELEAGSDTDLAREKRAQLAAENDGVAPESMRVGPTAGEQPAETIEKEGGIGSKETVRRKKAHAMEFLTYFSEWRHFKTLLGTCLCWFFLDIAYVFPVLLSRHTNPHFAASTADRKSTRLNSSHSGESRMPSSA